MSMVLAHDILRHLNEVQNGTETLGEDADQGPEAEPGNAGENTQALRIASIFVILMAGVIGGLPPLFLKV